MSRQFSRILRLVFCGLFVLSLGGSVLLLKEWFPRITQSSYQFTGEEEQRTVLPLLIEGAPASDFTVTLTLERQPWGPLLYYLAPDDCINHITVNGKEVRSTDLPFCDFRNGRYFNLKDNLQAGKNTIVLAMTNNGWPAGITVSASFFDARFILLTLSSILCTLASFFCLSPLLVKNLFQKKKQPSTKSFFRTHRLFHIVLLLLSVLFGMILLVHVLFRLWYELQGPFTADTTLYWTVGRGILNGLLPYRDLFENKPPGIFLLSALSYWTVKTPYLTNLFQTLVLTIIPLHFLLRSRVWKKKSEGLDIERRILLWISFSIGLLLLLYTAERSGEVQVESFGAAFSVLFLWLISRQHWSYPFSILAGILLMLSIGFKEPFLLSALAGALLLVPLKLPSILKRVVLPLLVAGVLGATLMTLLGYLQPSLSIYLPEIFAHHLPESGSVLGRGFNISSLFSDLFSYSPWFACIVLVLFCSYCGTIIKLYATKPLHLLWHGCALLGGLYLTAVAVGMGGAYFNHHFVFAVPFYVALFLGIDPPIIQNRRLWYAVVLVFLSLIGGASQGVPITDVKGKMDYMNTWSKEPKEVASVIDDILDSCEENRYLFLGSNGAQPYAYTKHSPLGPLFFQYSYYFNGHRPWFSEQWQKMLKEAELVVVEKGWGMRFSEPLRSQLDDTPWKCYQKKIPEFDHYQILFRKRETIGS